jgi:hypothetical protein
MGQALRTVNITRYSTPLREGGSLPAIAEAEDGFLYVVKFRGAGQGSKALIADLLGGEIARACGFKVPEIVFATLDESFGRTEPDEEIQDLLKASVGLNLGLHYLSGAITFDPAVTKLTSLVASRIVWLDAYIMNVDRTCRNTNMLTWRNELWLIDHGASLYFHHGSSNPIAIGWNEAAVKPFTQIKDHVLLWKADEMEEADAYLKTLLTEEKLADIVSLVPENWIEKDFGQSSDDTRRMYLEFLTQRIKNSAVFLKEINHARESLI